MHNLSLVDNIDEQELYPQNEAIIVYDVEEQDDRRGIIRRSEVMNRLPFRI